MLSLLIRSFAVPIGLAFLGSIGGLLATNQGLGLYYPYSLYAIGMRANNPWREVDAPRFLTVCAVYTFLLAAVAVYCLRKRGISAL